MRRGAWRTATSSSSPPVASPGRTRPPWPPRVAAWPPSWAAETCAYSRRERQPLRGRLGVLLPELARRLLPGRGEAGQLPAPLRRAGQLRRAQQHLLPRPRGEPVRPLGRAGAGRLPLRRDDEPAADVRRARRGRGRVLPHGEAARRQARAAADQGPAGARRRVPAAPPRRARPGGAGGDRLPPRLLGRPGGDRAPGRARRGQDRRLGGRGRLPLHPAPGAAVRRGRRLELLAGKIRPQVAAGVDVYAFFRHEDEPTAPLYAERLRELVDRLRA